MPKKAPELSAVEVRRLTHPGLHAVGGVAGLLLQVTPSGARSWVLRATVGAKRRDIGLGGFPDVPLAQARERAREARDQIRQGIDPVEQRRAARDALRLAQAKHMSFEQAARKWFATMEPQWRGNKRRFNAIRRMEKHAFPQIGSMPVDAIELPHVRNVLEPLWQEKTETAQKLRYTLESVFDWAIASGYRKADNPAAWKGNLKAVLPNAAKVRKVKHHRALPWQEVGAFLQALRQREGISARALEFLVLTAARSGEVREATWEEIDLAARLWTVPGDRMKGGKTHRVPLSDEAVKLLESLPRFEGNNFVFPAPRGGALSDMSLSAVCKRMEVDAVPHGFRSSFKDWARSSTGYPDEVSELALAHVNSDATRAAYARDELLPQRARLMAEWARFCNQVQQAGDVVPMRGQKNEQA
jgi:integrase